MPTLLYPESECAGAEVALEPPARRRLDVVIPLLLVLLALAVRVHNIGFNSLSEDEVAKWRAVEQYRHGHFAGVNSEHPMLLKELAWASIAVGEWWTRVASEHQWPTLNPEGWLRLPNALAGAATAAVVYLLARQMMGVLGSFAAGFFWAFTPLTIALNRLAKEETLLTFFTLLGCYFYWRAKDAPAGSATRRWYDLSGISFGLGIASQYMLHLFGMNALAWHIAGRAGLDRKPLGSGIKRFLLVIVATAAVVNPVMFSPTNIACAWHWLHYATVHHSGYDFNGTLYLNFPSLLFAGVPWYFYVCLLLLKTPIPILFAIIGGAVLLMRRHIPGWWLFLCMAVLQMVVLSVCGGKWMRYSLSLFPFLFLAGGYAIEETCRWMKEHRAPALAVAGVAAIVFAWPLFNLYAWAPY